GKKCWSSMTEEPMQEFQKKSNKARIKSAKVGSKMERLLSRELTAAGYEVEIHPNNFCANQNLQFDLLVSPNIVIEADAPSHWQPIWGEDNLRKQQQADSLKNGLLLANGFVVLRLKHTSRSYSQYYYQNTLNHVLKILKDPNRKVTKTIIEVDLERDCDE